MDSAVAATGENCVATGGNGLPDLLPGLISRFRKYQIRLYTAISKHLQGGL